MKKVSKKQIRKSLEAAVSKAISALKVPAPGRKARKLLANFAKRYAVEIKKAIKKNPVKSRKVPAARRKVARKQSKIQ